MAKKDVQEAMEASQRKIDALNPTGLAYVGVTGDTYGQALSALRYAYAQGRTGLQHQFVKADGSSVVRPLTLEETVNIIVTDHEGGYKPLLKELFRFCESCTGIAYKAGTTKFKIIPVSPKLILLDNNFNQPFVSADYETQQGTELDTNRGKYNVPLTKFEVLRHAGWLEAVRDKSLLESFRDIVFAEFKTDAAMGFYTQYNPQQDQLWALGFGCSEGIYVNGWRLLNVTRFVRVNPSALLVRRKNPK